MLKSVFLVGASSKKLKTIKRKRQELNKVQGNIFAGSKTKWNVHFAHTIALNFRSHMNIKSKFQ